MTILDHLTSHADELRELSLRIGAAEALLAALRQERDRVLAGVEERIRSAPHGAIQFETLLDQLRAERLGVSVERVLAARIQERAADRSHAQRLAEDADEPGRDFGDL